MKFNLFNFLVWSALLLGAKHAWAADYAGRDLDGSACTVSITPDLDGSTLIEMNGQGQVVVSGSAVCGKPTDETVGFTQFLRTRIDAQAIKVMEFQLSYNRLDQLTAVKSKSATSFLEKEACLRLDSIFASKGYCGNLGPTLSVMPSNN